MSRFFCIGGALIDRKCVLHGGLIAGSSNPARLSTSHGGVARNIAETLARLGARVTLAAAIGDDESGRAIRSRLESLGVATDALIVMADAATAEYIAVLDGVTGDLALGIVAMDAAETAISAGTDAIIERAERGMTVFVDGNLDAQALERSIAAATRTGFRLVIDAVSVAKSRRLPARLDGVAVLFANMAQASAMTGLDPSDPPALARALRSRGAAAVVVTAGAGGVYAEGDEGAVFVPARAVPVVDVTGAGDSLVATTLWRLSLGDRLGEALVWGIAAAGATVSSPQSVHPDLSANFLREARATMEKR